jgi:predicted aspartyl protease
MIEGFVNADHQAWLRLIVRGSESREAMVEALIDTGFGGFLALPAELIAELQLTWLGAKRVSSRMIVSSFSTCIAARSNGRTSRDRWK